MQCYYDSSIIVHYRSKCIFQKDYQYIRLVNQSLVGMQTIIDTYLYAELEFSVNIEPSTISILNAVLYNSFSIVCTATIPENVTAVKSFVWRKGSSGTGTVLSNSDIGISITTLNADEAVSTSVLTTSETIPGSYLYTCDVTVLSYPSSATANIVVNGMHAYITIIAEQSKLEYDYN